MRSRRRAAAAMALAGIGGPALAQSIVVPQSPLIPQNVSISDKLDDEYKPVGGRIGSFILYPALELTGTHTDNVLATQNDKISDDYLTVKPSARLVSQGGVNRYTLNTYYSRDIHRHLESEDASNYGAITYIRIGDPGSNHLEFNGSAQHLYDSRENINNIDAARSPIRRGRYAGDLAYTQVINRLSLLGAVDALHINFQNAEDRQGNEISQYYRDFTSVGAHGEARYALRQGIQAIAKVSYDRIRYPFGPSSAGFDPLRDRNRDSRRIRAEAGFGFALNDILYGDATVGYLDRRYKPQVNAKRDIGGPSFGVDMVWNATPLTTVKVKAGRDFLESSARAIAGYESTGGIIEVQHSPWHSLVLAVAANLADIKPIAGPGRTRFEYGGAVTGRYLLSRRYAIEAEFRRSGRNSNDILYAYDAYYASIGLRVTL